MFDSTTFVIHKTRSGATLVSEFDSRQAATANAIQKLKRYERRHGKDRELHAATIEAAAAASVQKIATQSNADIDIELPNGVSILLTTRRLPPQLDRVQRAVRRVFWNRQARVEDGPHA